MEYNLKKMAEKVGCPRQKAPDIAKGYNAGTDGDAKDQKAMRKIISGVDR
jgi:hypothetical protein